MKLKGVLLIEVIPLVILLIALSNRVSSSDGKTVSCTALYDKGGAPAVFGSPECPQWVSGASNVRNPRINCDATTIQGRRKYQEDRILCDLDLRVPFHGINGMTELRMGMAAVFDGHAGEEASDMASKLFVDYFLLHTDFLQAKTPNGSAANEFMRTRELCDDRYTSSDLQSARCMVSTNLEEGNYREVVKEALVRTIRDISTAFTEEAVKDDLKSGSTAIVVLIADDQILVANVGDSKAILCSKTFQTPEEAEAIVREYLNDGRISNKEYKKLKAAASDGWTRLLATELNRDHHPDEEDERSRILKAGGYVEKYAGVARVNGQLAVSRAIGDLYYKEFGVISEPEVMEWRPLNRDDSYLVVSSDGIYESLTADDVCNILPDPYTPSQLLHTSIPPMSERILRAAYEEGSRDNMSVVVIPLRQPAVFNSRDTLECRDQTSI